MNYILTSIVAIGLIVWYIRPLYNFMAKRKYLLLDNSKLSFFSKAQVALPAIIFYTLILGLLLTPSFVNDQISNNQTIGVLAVQVVFIFFLTRYDKWQTKYKIRKDGIYYRSKTIKWDEPYSLKYKRTVFFILHKPRFIVVSHTTKIVIPLLSQEIEHFITTLDNTNKKLGKYAKELYENTTAYYVHNLEIEKDLNKLGK